MKLETPRFWIWASVIVQLVGLVVDALWHGLLHPDFEAQTFGEMVRHLVTVHLLLYVGVAALLVSTAWAALPHARRSGIGRAPLLAAAGAALQMVGEAWHAYSHLGMRPSPIPEFVGFVGLLAAIIATFVAGRAARPSPDRDLTESRHPTA
jgi:hypothetical protein